MNVSDEAVRAGFLACYERDHVGGIGRGDIRRILEAAAPHMMAGAWEEGAEAEASVACDYYIPCGSCATCTGPDLINPYRKPHDA